MSDLQKVRTFLEQWKRENRDQLPINVDTWKITVVAHQKQAEPSAFPEQPEAKRFFKPISRLIEFKNEQ